MSSAKQRIFNHNILNVPVLRDTSKFLGILVKTAWFYHKRLQSDGALNFVQFFWAALCICVVMAKVGPCCGPGWICKCCDVV